MTQSQKAVQSVLIIMFFTLASKVLGFIREILIAAKFGSGVETDTFFIALTATTLFTTFFTQSINTTMIPILSEVERKEGILGKRSHTNNLLNIVMVISFFLVIVAWFLAPLIIRILAHGFEGEQFNQTVLLMRIGLPVFFFASAVGIFRGYLQSEMKFTESAIAQFPFNFVYIFFLVFLADLLGIKGLMVASVLAVGAQILIQIPGLRKINFQYQFIFDVKDYYVKKILHLVPPVLISVAVSDINKIVDRSLASTLIDGSVSALNYSNRLKGLIIGIFTAAIVTVLFPLLSQKADKNNHDEFKSVFRYGVNTILLITVPATVGMIVLAEPIVRLSFERGAFDATASYMTAGALIFYSIGIVGMGLKSFLNRAYYALQDTKTPMYNGFIAIGVNIVLNFILVQFMAHRGLALATSISAILSSLLLLYGLKRKIGPLGIKNMLTTGIKVLASSLIMGFATLHVYRYLSFSFTGSTLIDLIVLSVSIGFGALVYLLLIYLMKVKELFWFINLFKKKLSRKKKSR
ncbi:integral membrane protein MviN [Alkaliphilus metalliredigens QYMF]|uniref:Probable lipid II flippase MurJ n=1 Tax=Alkaliphilus metalliredigens (strain QYMF) TaxID=293826 RepID=A6TJT1_ALKMQ|nr:murein biosynthesis integral membrane protein MurJ [Alkaliphilus metalliredigens]ABR46449.1 integral membrane protein MviN [Alkaliphilus metalliredigens QYMF]